MPRTTAATKPGVEPLVDRSAWGVLLWHESPTFWEFGNPKQ
jgi:hypothetical protein